MSAILSLTASTGGPRPAPSGSDAFAAYLADETTKALVARYATARGWPATTVRAGGLAAAARILAVAEPPALLVLDVSDSADPATDFEALCEAIDDGCQVIVVGASNDARLYRSLLAKGAVDYLVKPFDEAALAEAVDRAGRGRQPRASVRKARIVAVTGARGGVGASTVSCTLAALFAAEHRLRTTLVDLDLRFGDAALALGVACGPGLRECLEAPERMDDLFLERAVVDAGERLRVLAAEEPISDEFRPAGDALARLIDHLGNANGMIVVDLPRGTPALPEAVAVADELVVAAELTLSAARDALRLKQMVEGIQGAPTLRFVANRTGKGGIEQISRGEFESVVCQRLAACLPVDLEAAAMAASAGRPLSEVARRSGVVTQLSALAYALAGTTPKRSGLLGRLLARRAR